MTKCVHREKVAGQLWVDVEPLNARDLFLYEDSDGYSSAMKALRQKHSRFYRVIARLAVGKTTDEILTAIATKKQKAVTTAKKWAAQERALQI
jgi:hypothetical protein